MGVLCNILQCEVYKTGFTLALSPLESILELFKIWLFVPKFSVFQLIISIIKSGPRKAPVFFKELAHLITHPYHMPLGVVHLFSTRFHGSYLRYIILKLSQNCRFALWFLTKKIFVFSKLLIFMSKYTSSVKKPTF